MDRLTDETDAHDIGCHATGYEDIIASLHGYELERIYMCLAAYEDTGLTPAEVEAMKAELAEAQRYIYGEQEGAK